MAVPSALPNFVRAGLAGAEDLAGGDGKFLKIKTGKPVQIIPLTGVEGIISFNQHALWLEEGSSPVFPCFDQPWCPGEIIGDKPKFKALMLCVTTEEPERELILSMGISIFKQIVGVAEAVGDIKGQVIRITRTGEKLTTRYTVMPTNRRAKLTGEPETNLLEHLGEMDPDVVVGLLEKAGLWTDDHQASYDAKRKIWKAKEKAKRVAAKAAAAAKLPVMDVDGEDDDEDEVVVETSVVETPTKKATPPVEPAPVEPAPVEPAPVDVDDDDMEEEVPPAKPAPKAKATKPAPVPVDDDEMEDIDEE